MYIILDIKVVGRSQPGAASLTHLRDRPPLFSGQIKYTLNRGNGADSTGSLGVIGRPLQWGTDILWIIHPN
jgi:hypothetical protein